MGIEDMNAASEMPIQNLKKKFETYELEPKERENLASAWVDLVVEDAKVPDDVKNWNDDEIRSWLSETFMADVAQLVKEWELKPNEILIKDLQKEKDPVRRAEIEMRYLESTNAAIRQFEETEKLKQKEDRSDKWDSWPRQMREVRQFNCVGGTLLGINLLDRADIKSYYGNPAGHVLNIVKLSNGEWIYADFTNNHIQKLSPEVKIIGGIETLVINDPKLAYHLIPLMPNTDAPKSVLGNLNSAITSTKEDPPDSPDRKEAERIQARFSEHFKKNDFGDLADNLYPQAVKFRRTQEAQNERERVDRIREEERTIASFFNGLSFAERELVAKEKQAHAHELRRYLTQGDKAVLTELSEPLRRNLPALYSHLEKIKESDPEFYEDFLHRLL